MKSGFHHQRSWHTRRFGVAFVNFGGHNLRAHCMEIKTAHSSVLCPMWALAASMCSRPKFTTLTIAGDAKGEAGWAVKTGQGRVLEERAGGPAGHAVLAAAGTGGHGGGAARGPADGCCRRPASVEGVPVHHDTPVQHDKRSHYDWASTSCLNIRIITPLLCANDGDDGLIGPAWQPWGDHGVVGGARSRSYSAEA